MRISRIVSAATALATSSFSSYLQQHHHHGLGPLITTFLVLVGVVLPGACSAKPKILRVEELSYHHHHPADCDIITNTNASPLCHGSVVVVEKEEDSPHTTIHFYCGGNHRPTGRDSQPKQPPQPSFGNDDSIDTVYECKNIILRVDIKRPGRYQLEACVQGDDAPQQQMEPLSWSVDTIIIIMRKLEQDNTTTTTGRRLRLVDCSLDVHPATATVTASTRQPPNEDEDDTLIVFVVDTAGFYQIQVVVPVVEPGGRLGQNGPPKPSLPHLPPLHYYYCLTGKNTKFKNDKNGPEPLSWQLGNLHSKDVDANTSDDTTISKHHRWLFQPSPEPTPDPQFIMNESQTKPSNDHSFLSKSPTTETPTTARPPATSMTNDSTDTRSLFAQRQPLLEPLLSLSPPSKLQFNQQPTTVLPVVLRRSTTAVGQPPSSQPPPPRPPLDTSPPNTRSMPSPNPSLVPSSWPPTTLPSRWPSIAPTALPSRRPTIAPTALPTTSPSLFPTVVPTLPPTAIPSVFPSLLPSLIPSTSPTTVPSDLPSNNPTEMPSEFPTSTPSRGPTNVPSYTPTSNPTTIPSLRPSMIPSPIPTTGPSNIPSATPSGTPTHVPSSPTSTVPSLQPTTLLPSRAPKALTSMIPTQLSIGGQNQSVPELIQPNKPEVVDATNGTERITIGPATSPSRTNQENGTSANLNLFQPSNGTASRNSTTTCDSLFECQNDWMFGAGHYMNKKLFGGLFCLEFCVPEILMERAKDFSWQCGFCPL